MSSAMSSASASPSLLFSGPTLFDVNVEVIVENLITLIRLLTFV